MGHLATTFGVTTDLTEDASDIVYGEEDDENFERFFHPRTTLFKCDFQVLTSHLLVNLFRCIKEIVHIRGCLRLSTQCSRRQQRSSQRDTVFQMTQSSVVAAHRAVSKDTDADCASDSDSSSSSSEGEAGSAAVEEEGYYVKEGGEDV